MKFDSTNTQKPTWKASSSPPPEASETHRIRQNQPQ
jgi:hypothetical protein